jgi:hypothetical protein
MQNNSRNDVGTPWLPIIVSAVGVIGSLVTAAITSRASVANQVNQASAHYLDRRFRNLTLADVQSGSTSARGGALEHAPTDVHGRYIKRLKQVHISFRHPFSATPQVIVLLTSVDARNDDNLRVAVYTPTQNIHKDGFDIQFTTWSTTTIYRASANWFAYQLSPGESTGP